MLKIFSDLFPPYVCAEMLSEGGLLLWTLQTNKHWDGFPLKTFQTNKHWDIPAKDSRGVDVSAGHRHLLFPSGGNIFRIVKQIQSS